MRWLIPGISVVAAVASLAIWAVLGNSGAGRSQTTTEVVRDIQDVPRKTEVETVSHREERFAPLTTIEEILALPPEIDRTAALHDIAGRSDSAQVQNLIDQVNRVTDAFDRRGGFDILFSRLTDLDPQSALAIATQTPYADEPSIEATVWRSWALRDLGD